MRRLQAVMRLLLLVATAKAEKRITGCIWQPTLPSALFRDPNAYGYGSGRVDWTVLESPPIRVDPQRRAHGDDVVCDALFWQDEDWFSPANYFTTYKKLEHASHRMTSRVVAGWVSERCMRTNRVVENYDFVWYPGPKDQTSHLVPLPLGASAAFPSVRGNTSNVEKFEFLVNYLASLETSPIRRTWYRDATSLQRRLEKRGRYCAYIRSHTKWQEPKTYKAEEIDVEHCTCSRIATCNNDTIGTLTSEQFCSILERSAFTLSPPGHNYQSFRHWEAAAVASIPVVINPRKSESPCVQAESYFFADAPFIYADTPMEALDPMLALAKDPEKLKAQRLRVRKWYDDHMTNAVHRVEAAMTSAAAISDAVYGAPDFVKKLKIRPLAFFEGRERRKPKRNGFILAPDGNFASQLLTWLTETHGIDNSTAKRSFVDEMRDDGCISSGWAYAGAADLLSPFSSALRSAIPQPLTNIKMAPVVTFSRDPLAFIPDLAKRIDTFRPQKSTDDESPDDEDTVFLGVVTGDAARLAVSFDNVDPKHRSTALAAHYWLQWSKRAYDISSFSFRIEDFDPISCLLALGIRRTPAVLSQEHKYFPLDTTSSRRTTWSSLASAIAPGLFDDITALANDLGYDIYDH